MNTHTTPNAATPVTPVVAPECFEIAIPVTVDAYFLYDVMTTAVESAYEWFGFSKVVRLAPDHVSHGLCITSFTAHEIDCDDTGKTIAKWQITPATILAAMARLASDKSLVCAVTREYVITALAENDAGNIDADVADCILQIACFGELRYG